MWFGGGMRVVRVVGMVGLSRSVWVLWVVDGESVVAVVGGEEETGVGVDKSVLEGEGIR